MRRVYKLTGKLISVSVLFIIFIYGVLFAYIQYTDSREVRIVSNIKSIYSRVKTPHQIEFLSQGIESLSMRIDLIRKAQKSIEVEFFIYELDETSKLFTYELIQAAKRGVKVKVLVDYSIAVFALAPEYASYLKREGIEVRYYNTVANANIIAAQHRNHRKLLIVDENKLITGGRNIANDYFDINSRYNFLDFDIFVTGEIVSNIRDSFFNYWDSDYASNPQETNIILDKNFFNDITSFDHITSHLEKLKDKIQAKRFPYTCHDIAYVTDFPGVLVSNRQVYKRIAELMGESKREIIAETPYLVLRKDGLDLLKNTLQKGVNISLFTNGLNTTDAYYTSSALALKFSEIEDIPFNLYLYRGGNPYKDYPQINNHNSLWGIHSKRAVIDNKHIIVGTYNVDPRSANLNSEMIIICRDNEKMARDLKKDFLLRLAYAKKLKHGDYKVSSLTQGSDFSKVIKFYLVMPLVYFLDFLL